METSYRTGDGNFLDFIDFHGIASHVYGIAELGGSYIFSDWKRQSVVWDKGYSTVTLIADMYRPSQVFLQELYISPGELGRKEKFSTTKEVLEFS